MVKIFVGNLSSNTKPEEIEDLFGRHGKVLECAVLGSYGFVHMSPGDADIAIKLVLKLVHVFFLETLYKIKRKQKTF